MENHALDAQCTSLELNWSESVVVQLRVVCENIANPDLTPNMSVKENSSN